jgi:hypothetical protein
MGNNRPRQPDESGNRLWLLLDVVKGKVRGSAEGKWAVVALAMVATCLLAAAVILGL